MIQELCTCSKTYLKYSHLINPYPKNPESEQALINLHQSILIPIFNKFGLENLKLTYGFCSKDLKKFLTCEKSRICIEVDQHMSYETNNKGKYYCKHLGAACDFKIIGVDSTKVIGFLRNLDFDSIYYYGKDKSVHVSWSQSPRRKIWEFTAQNTPKPYSNYYWV
ncbi:hypothetical protein [Nostoc sp. PA-18-2419]|uniref:hypothetical protein n=1 Tax=Nostoc sp. PA-18-2419 TaxID=2575443 RepID=UPI001109BA0C|nr:hypothetical protein [Nostoc sp. PA-18-2419]